MILLIFHDFNLQKGSLKGNITFKKTLSDGQMIKNHDKKENHDHEMSGFTFEMLMSITSNRYPKFLSEMRTAIRDR